MEYRHFLTVFLALTFYAALVSHGNADVDLYLCPPSPAYFSSLDVGDDFTVEVVAEADDPGVTLFAFTVIWLPENSVEFVRPVSEYLPELAMTGFFPPTSPNFSRLSEIVPNWRTLEATGSPGVTPQISVFTAPAANHTGPDSLARITFRKLSTSQPTFILTDATAEEYLGGVESRSVSVASNEDYVVIDIGSAMMSGAMFSRSTAVVVTIGGNDYLADVVGDAWMLDMKTVMPSLDAQPITVKAMQGGSLLSSVTITDLIRSPGWYRDQTSRSERPGDGNGDGIKDVRDLTMLGGAYGTSVGDDRYDFRSDYNADGVVNLADLLIFAYYGR